MDCTRFAVPTDLVLKEMLPSCCAAVRAAVAAPVVDTPEDVDAMDAFLATLKC